MERKLKSFHEFTKANENLEFEEDKQTTTASSSGTATPPASTTNDSVDFGEDQTPAEPAATTPEETEIKNKDLVAKLSHMIAILNSHRSMLRNEVADENLVKKVNNIYAEFNKY
jgi:hypothetical protein